MADVGDNTSVGVSGLDSALVRTQLAKVLAHELFAGSPQICRLLERLVESALAGDLREVKEYAIGVELYGRGASFDPRLDNIVRANARRLRSKLSEYFSGPG